MNDFMTQTQAYLFLGISFTRFKALREKGVFTEVPNPLAVRGYLFKRSELEEFKTRLNAEERR